MNYEAARKVLQARLSEAKEQERKAAARFNEVAADFPSSVPYPDSTTRLQDAARIYRSSMRELGLAQEEMANFLLAASGPKEAGSKPPH